MNRFIFGCIVTIALLASVKAQTPSPTPAATPPSSVICVIDVKTKLARKTLTDELKFAEPNKISDFAR